MRITKTKMLSIGERKILDEQIGSYVNYTDINWVSIDNRFDLFRGINDDGNVAILIDEKLVEGLDPATIEFDGTNRVHKFKENNRQNRIVLFNVNGYDFIRYNLLEWYNEAILKETDTMKIEQLKNELLSLEEEVPEEVVPEEVVPEEVFQEEEVLKEKEIKKEEHLGLEIAKLSLGMLKLVGLNVAAKICSKLG